MNFNNKFKGSMIFLILILIFSDLVLADYSRSNFQYLEPGITGFFGGGSERVQCQEGQDFVVQIAPGGCELLPVRSDLLEERNVQVYCPLIATKINPLIDVNAIRYVNIKAEDLPSGVSDADFYPTRAALGQKKLISGDETFPFLENIGYAVIVLKKQKNESSMPNFVEGNLTAVIKYDLENAFGIGTSRFFLPEISDADWSQSRAKYSFWNGRYSVRADTIAEDSATISVYEGDIRITSVNLNKGEKSRAISLPGFDCMAGLQLKLNDLKTPIDKVELKINADLFEFIEGEKFLENKCKINEITKRGIYQKVSITCKEDSGKKSFDLIKNPKVNLTICDKENTNCELGKYEIGSKLFSFNDKGLIFDDEVKNIFLGYVGTKENSNKKEDLFVVLIALPKQNLEERDLSFISSLVKNYDYSDTSENDDVGDFAVNNLKKLFGASYQSAYSIIKGSDVETIRLGEQKEIWDKTISLSGFGDAEDLILSDDTGNNYQKAGENYQTILDNFPDQESEYLETNEVLGERALLNYIKTSYDLSQNLKTAELCKEFLDYYPNSKNKVEVYCEDFSKLSSSEFFSRDVLINDEIKTISFFGISEPTSREYSVKVNVNGDSKTLPRDGVYYLTTGSEQSSQQQSSPTGEFLFDTNRNKNDVGEIVKDKFGPACSRYLDDVMEASRYGVDPLLIFSIIKQESSCSEGADSGITTGNSFCNGASYGLMQISGRTWCGKYGLPANPSSDMSDYCKTHPQYTNVECINELKETSKNVEVGTEILRAGYNENSRHYVCNSFKSERQDELAVSKNYSKWERALRAYNGWGCAGYRNDGSEIFGDQTYVEKILNNFATLGGQAVSGGQTTTSTSDEFIKLKELTEDYVIFDASSVKKSSTSFESSSLKINLGESVSIGNNRFIINVPEINLEKQAEVSISANMDNAGTESDFSFKIGIEKRAFKLSPAKTKEKIEKLNESIKKFENIANNLEKVVKGLSASCLGVGTTLNIKNLLTNLGGKGIARQKVMMGAGGWDEICQSALITGEVRGRDVDYKTLNECFTKEKNNINNDTDAMYAKIKSQNDEMKAIEESTEDINELKRQFLSKHESEIKSNLGFIYPQGMDFNGEIISVNDFVENYLDTDTFSVEQLKDLELYSNLNVNVEGLKDLSESRLTSGLTDLYNNRKEDVRKKGLSERFGVPVAWVASEKAREIQISQDVTWGDIKNKFNNLNLFNDNDLVYILGSFSQPENYLVLLSGDHTVMKTFMIDSSGEKYSLAEQESANPFDVHFTIVDSSLYKNKFLGVAGEDNQAGPVIKFYDTAPYAGLPALVPFDVDNGWYAAVEQTLPVFGQISAYGESGRVESWYICNVGKNGIAEFFNEVKDDSCALFNAGVDQPENQLLGLDSVTAQKVIRCANQAIESASKLKTKSGTVSISTDCKRDLRLEIGTPAVNVPSVQCQDFMSPGDCQLLFNVCDPVVCPSSRCNLGGNYYVQNVVQSGIIGSIALCAPNIREGIYMPVCVSGVYAGIQSFTAMQRDYRDCLQHHLETGEQIGVCDAVNSFYMCELVWRNMLPIAKLALPKALEVASGNSPKGGGEYLSVKDAWSNAQNSMEYFMNYYSSSAVDSFNVGSTQSIVGGDVCKYFPSASTPSSITSLNKLIEPKSPPQFWATSEEVPYTTATNPPTSQYKVTYFIYAGDNTGVYFRVYLKGSSSSFYEDTENRRLVDSGFIPAGNQKSKSPDFTDVSGYKELCVMINEQEYCGFKQVTSDFGVNYIKEKYVASQAFTNVTSTKDCVSGTPNIYASLTPSLQQGIEGSINPEIYNNGIIRICSTSNPSGTERWIPVGYCDDKKLECWLDTESVDKTIKNKAIKEGALEEQTQEYLEALQNEQGYLTPEAYANLIKEIEKKDSESAITTINQYLSKAFLNREKGYLYLLKGNAYSELARKINENNKPTSTESTSSGGGSQQQTQTGQDITLQNNEFTQESIVFEFQDGSFFEKNLYYRFDDNQWYVSKDKKNWFNIFVINTLFQVYTTGDYQYTLTPPVQPDATDFSYVYLTSEYFKMYIESEGVSHPESRVINSKTIQDFTDVLGDFTNYVAANKEDYILTERDYQFKAETQDVLAYIDPMTKLFIGLSEKDKRLILILGKSYESGVKSLIDRTIKNNEGAWYQGNFQETDLVTDKVSLNHEGIFEIDGEKIRKANEPRGWPIYLKYANNKWRWSSEKKYWYDFPRKTNDFEQIDSLLISLDEGRKNLYEGAKIIFGINAG